MKEVWLLPLILQLGGILVIIVEVIVPSAGILAMLAIGLFSYSLYIVFTDISTSAGVWLLTADIIIVPIFVILGLKLLAKSPVTLRKTLSQAEGVTSQSSELETYINTEGIAATNLRPSGVAIIKGKRLDVVTRGDYIEKDTKIFVYEVTGNQIIVRKKEE